MTLILNGTNGVSDVDGSASTPAIRGTDTNTGMFFPAADTIAFAEGGAEVMRIDSSGNLGIGTSSPSTRLQINATSTGNVIRWTDGVTDTGSVGIVSGGGVNVWAGGFLAFGAGGGASYTERMRIDSSGNLLVGSSSNHAVTSRQHIAWDSRTLSNGIGLTDTDPTSVGRYAQVFYRNGSNVGSIQTTLTATVYVTSSDYRLKENVAPMVGALAKVAQLKPCTYTWKSTGEASQGFIAHELAEVVPDCVTGEKDAVDADGKPVYQGIDTSFLVATLTAAIQEQQAIINDLKARIETLENK